MKLGLGPLGGLVTLVGFVMGCATTAVGQDATVEAAPGDVRSASAGAPAREGAVAPDFVGQGNLGSNVSLASLRGRTVVLFFYGRDETPSAVREAIDFRDVAAKLRNEGVEIVGISTDGVETHRAFAERLQLSYPLVSDPRGAIATAFGVPTAYGIADRRTFIIGPDGTIEKVYRDVDPSRHAAEVVARVTAARNS